MSANARMAAALSHTKPDRTPYFEYVLLPPVASQLLGRSYCDYAGDLGQWCACAREIGWENAVRRYARDRVDLAEKLGHDLLYIVPNPLPSAVEFHQEPEPRGSDVSHFSRFLTDDPVVSLHQRIEFGLLELEVPLNPDCLLVYDLISKELDRRGMAAYLLAPAYYHGVWTDTDLMQTIVLSPGTAHMFFAVATNKALRMIDAYLKLGIELIGVGGDFAGKRPIISPESYRTFITPEINKLSSRIHSAGGFSVNASDGNLWPVIEDFLTGCDADGYLEIDSNAGMSLRELKAAYGDSITFFGNMDCGQALSFLSPEEIRALTHQCLEDGGGCGGHVFCASNAITESVPIANYMAMVNAYKDFFGLARVII
jgi:hypothetical protein